MLMSCLISVLLELARLIGTYNMTYNISTVIFDHNFKFSPQAVLLCGISDSFFFFGRGGCSSDTSTWFEPHLPRTPLSTF